MHLLPLHPDQVDVTIGRRLAGTEEGESYRKLGGPGVDPVDRVAGHQGQEGGTGACHNSLQS